jgi:hypothetical protein
MIPDEPTRRRALDLMQSAYRRLYGEVAAEAAREDLLAQLELMAERMASTPGGWRDHADASTAERMAAVLLLPLSDEERERLASQVDAALAASEACRRRP